MSENNKNISPDAEKEPVNGADENTAALSDASEIKAQENENVSVEKTAEPTDDDVLSEIKEVLPKGQLIVSIVAGRSVSYYQKMLGKKVRLVRLMPNTPALVGAGMTAACCSPEVSDREMEEVGELCRTFGLFEIVPESLFDAVTGVSGSSPAYVFMMMEAMADAAVLGGMPRAQAYKFVAQAVLGSAKMMLDTGKHPGELKDMVCSPAGTTIEAVSVLEERGFRSAVIEGTVACIEKSAQMNASKN